MALVLAFLMLLRQIQERVSPAIRPVKPAKEFHMPPAPAALLMRNCPLLQAPAYVVRISSSTPLLQSAIAVIRLAVSAAVQEATHVLNAYSRLFSTLTSRAPVQTATFPILQLRDAGNATLLANPVQLETAIVVRTVSTRQPLLEWLLVLVSVRLEQCLVLMWVNA